MVIDVFGSSEHESSVRIELLRRNFFLTSKNLLKKSDISVDISVDLSGGVSVDISGEVMAQNVS